MSALPIGALATAADGEGLDDGDARGAGADDASLRAASFRLQHAVHAFRASMPTRANRGSQSRVIVFSTAAR